MKFGQAIRPINLVRFGLIALFSGAVTLGVTSAANACTHADQGLTFIVTWPLITAAVTFNVLRVE